VPATTDRVTRRMSSRCIRVRVSIRSMFYTTHDTRML
jgi:hypothetical protein